MTGTTLTDAEPQAVMARYLAPEIMAELVETTKAGERWARAHPEAAARLTALMEEVSTMTETEQQAAMAEVVALLKERA